MWFLEKLFSVVGKYIDISTDVEQAGRFIQDPKGQIILYVKIVAIVAIVIAAVVFVAWFFA